MYFFLLLGCLFAQFASCGVEIEFLSSQQTPDSVLTHPEDFTPLFVGSRPRYGTLSAAVWFHNDYLAVFNLLGERVDVYHFDSSTRIFTHIQEISQQNSGAFGRVIHADISPDGTLLAVSFCGDNPKIVLYAIDLETHRILPHQLAAFNFPKLVHNVRFSPDGNFLGAVSFDKTETIVMYAIQKNAGDLLCQQIQLLPSPYPTVVGKAAKSINFTADGRFAIVSYGPGAKGKSGNEPTARLDIFERDPATGLLGEIINQDDADQPAYCFEDAVLFNNDTQLLYTDQNNDRFILYEFDPVHGRLNPHARIISSESLNLNFPHGLALRNNNLVVTNYGSDAFNLLTITFDS